MPHIIIEHSACIDEKIIDQMLVKIPNLMSEIKGGNFEIAGCKARAIGFDRYYAAGQSPSASSFTHITIKILEGRSNQIKLELAQKIGDFAKKLLENRKNLKKSNDLSIDIVDLDKSTYQKLSY